MAGTIAEQRAIGHKQLRHAANNIGYDPSGWVVRGGVHYKVSQVLIQLGTYLQLGDAYAGNTARMLRELADKIEGPVKIDIKEIYGED
jgi:hypothetical protein